MKLCRAQMHGIRKITKIYIKLNLLNQRSDFLVLAVSLSSLSFKVSPSMLFFSVLMSLMQCAQRINYISQLPLQIGPTNDIKRKLLDGVL